MGIFDGKRRDGTLVTGITPYTRVEPFLMRGRNESVVYHAVTIDATNALAYLAKRKAEGHAIGFFPLVLAALLRTAAERPHINRFIAGKRMYMRNRFDVSYVVKRQLTDEAPDSTARISFSPDATIFTVADAVIGSNKRLKTGGEANEDNLLNAFAGLPKPFLSFIAACVRWMDNHNCLPQSITDSIPMYASVFASNLGSIGGGAPFHHLYEFGTTSIFLTIGRICREPTVLPDGTVASRPVAKLSFTVDERICDGFYLIRSLQLFESYLLHPELLEAPYRAPAAGGRNMD